LDAGPQKEIDVNLKSYRMAGAKKYACAFELYDPAAKKMAPCGGFGNEWAVPGFEEFIPLCEAHAVFVLDAKARGECST
jgi:hypothetical protein